MKRSKIIAPSVLILGSSIFASVQANVDEYDFNVMKKRVEALEQVALATTVSGEISATYGSGANTTLGDAKFSISHAVNEQFDGSIAVKWDDGDANNDIILEEAVMNYNHESFTVSMARIGLPFGAYDTGMITDPLTKSGVTDADKGEQDLLMVSTSFGDVEIAAYTYEATDADRGLSINYANDMFSIGYDHFNDGTDGRSSSGAVRAGFNAGNGMSVAYEKVTTDQTTGDQSAQHVEVNYAHTLMNTDANLTIARSDEDVAAGDTSQNGFTYSIMPTEGVTFAVERNKVSNASAINTAKLTYEF